MVIDVSDTNKTEKFTNVEAISSAWSRIEGSVLARSRQAMERRRRIVEDAVKCGIPNTRNEEWKYTSLRPLIERSFRLVDVYDERTEFTASLKNLITANQISGAIPLVFVDGKLADTSQASTLRGKVRVRTISEVETEEDAAWWDIWSPKLHESRIFSKICMGLSSEGVVIEVSKNVQIDGSFHILHIHTGKKSQMAFNNRVLISAGEGAQFNVFEEFLSLRDGELESTCWNNNLTQVRLGSNARCGYQRVVNCRGDFHTGAVSANLEQKSHFQCVSVVLGSKLTRVDVDVVHSATESECGLFGLNLLRGESHADQHTSVDHLVGHTRTNQLFKGVLDDQSRLVFNGKIFIRKNAQKTEAYQTCKNLLLSRGAEANAKPQLEIDADDVKASHGAAIGSIDDQELFYLQSRCIGREEAKAMLCRGFADDVVQKVEDERARSRLKELVSQWFIDGTGKEIEVLPQ